MYKHYYLNLNQQSNGDYEVHAGDCIFFKYMTNKDYLGYFNNCKDAVAKAKEKHPYKSRINGCFFCCKSCHTS